MASCLSAIQFKKIRSGGIILAIPLLFCFPQLASAATKREALINRTLDTWEDKLAKPRPKVTEPLEAPPAWAQNQDSQNWPEPSHQPSFFKFNDDPDEKLARENIAPERTKTHTFQASAETFWAKYEEPELMEQRGALIGYNGSYTYRPDKENLFYNPFVNTFRIEGLFAHGKFKYEAEDASQAGLQIDKDNYMFEMREILGREYILDGIKIMPYIGFGYRYLNDDSDEKATLLRGSLILGYERESRYYYIPVGAVVSVPLKNKWNISVNGEYDYFMHGKQTSHLSDADVYTGNSNTDLDNKQNNGGYGLRTSLQLAKETPHLTFFIEPYFRYWNIEESEESSGVFDGSAITGVEPENTTVEEGIRLGLLF